MTFKVIFSNRLHFKDGEFKTQIRCDWFKVTWVGDSWQRRSWNPGHLSLQVTQVPFPIWPPPSVISVFDKPEKALLLTSGRKASQKEQLACSLYFLLRIFVSTVSQKIFLLPLENIIYKVEAITQGWSVLVFFASPRRINSPLTGSLAIAVLELAFALFTGLNNADVVI